MASTSSRPLSRPNETRALLGIVGCKPLDSGLCCLAEHSIRIAHALKGLFEKGLFEALSMEHLWPPHPYLMEEGRSEEATGCFLLLSEFCMRSVGTGKTCTKACDIETLTHNSERKTQF